MILVSCPQSFLRTGVMINDPAETNLTVRQIVVYCSHSMNVHPSLATNSGRNDGCVVEPTSRPLLQESVGGLA